MQGHEMKLATGDDPGGGRYADLLRQCKSLAEGKKLHRSLSEAGHGANSFIQNLLVQMYGKCRSLREARAVFDSMNSRNVYSWTIMIAAYAQNDQLVEARRAFDAMPCDVRGVVPWNTIISSYSRTGMCAEAVQLLRLMDLDGVCPNDITFMSLLDGCSGAKELQQGQKVHEIIESSRFTSDVRVVTALVDLYGKCGELEKAKLVFDAMQRRNVVSWNAMIAAYGKSGWYREAISLFRLMAVEGVRADDANFTSVLDACAECGDLETGRVVHSCVAEAGLETRLLVATALLNMYGSCGDVDRAEEMFGRAEGSDLVMWTALVMAYGKNGRGKQAFRVFQRMDLEGFELDEACFVGTLNACAGGSTAAEGKLVHRCVLEDTSLMESSVQAGNAVVHFYGQCGELKTAWEVFQEMKVRDLVTWNTLITGYAQNGSFEETIDLFRSMALDGVAANGVTLVSVLSACSHAGKLADALCYFTCMKVDYEVEGVEEHLACVVDLMGRLGELREAEGLTQGMTEVGWFSYLSACIVHGNVDAAVKAADAMLKLDPRNSALYTLLSNAKKLQVTGA